MYYFHSRTHAGRLLAVDIAPRYAKEKCSVLALSDGGVVVGMQIARELHCPIGMLLSEAIELPQEMMTIAGISQDGSFTYNKIYSPGEIEEMLTEYRGVIESQKMEKLQQMHRLMGKGGLARRDLLEHRTIILVSDGMSNGFSLDLAMEFLKPINFPKLVVATPQASIGAVDRMHILADDLYVLNVLEDYISTDHYYDTKDIPSHKVIVETISHLMKEWT
jgi:putative phosphoribosyl transferase